MASTYSTNLGIELMGTGDQSGTWGTTTNTNLGTLLEQAIAGYATQAVTDGAATVLTITNGAASTGRNPVIVLTGTLTADRVVEVPAKTKLYVFKNSTTGGFNVTVKVTGQTGVTIANGKTAYMFCNATDTVEIFNAPVTEAGTQTLTNKTINASTIGASSPGAITGTTITANTAFAGPHNGTVGATTPSTGAFTTGTFSTSITLPLMVATGGNSITAQSASGQTSAGIKFNNGAGTALGFVYGDGTNMSFLNNSGTSIFYVANSTGNANVTGTLTVASSASATGSLVSNGASAALQFADRTTTSNNWVWYSTSNVAYLYSNIAGATGNKLSLDSSGNFVATGNVTAYSDERVKTNWRDLPVTFISDLSNIKSGVYDRTDIPNTTQVGVSAQSLLTLLPEAVVTNLDGYFSVSYGNAALAAAIELAKEVVKLRADIEELKARPSCQCGS